MKTADEMLEELGFRKNTSECYGEDKKLLLYEKPVMQGTDIFELWFHHDGSTLYTNTARNSIWMSYDLVAAVAAKCKELGWK